MSAIEETWQVGHGWEQNTPGIYIYSDRHGGNIVVAEDEPSEPFMSEEHAKIAACAPEALRMLLGCKKCPGCGCYRGAPDMGGVGGETKSHSDTCEWLALMKKAGLR